MLPCTVVYHHHEPRYSLGSKANTWSHIWVLFDTVRLPEGPDTTCQAAQLNHAKPHLFLLLRLATVVQLVLTCG
jgi:hypothetical protein